MVVTGPCEFLVMYGWPKVVCQQAIVTGPCEFLVMYGYACATIFRSPVTGPCEFLVMYGSFRLQLRNKELQDPVNF